MVTTIAVHSHKGGTGKSIIAVNLASMLAVRGYRVVILDMDLAAPTLQTYFPYDKTKRTLTEYFLGEEIPISDMIFEVTNKLPENAKGKLFAGLSSIDGGMISKIDQRGRTAPLNDLYRLIGLVRNKLVESPWNADFVVLDTSPGVSMSSINNVAVAEHLFIIQKLINADLAGTVELLKIIHQSLRPNTSIIVNQLPEKFVKHEGTEIADLIKEKVIKPLNRPNIWFGGVINHDEFLIENEIEYVYNSLTNPQNSGREIYSLKYPDYPFSISIKNVLDTFLEVVKDQEGEG